MIQPQAMELKDSSRYLVHWLLKLALAPVWLGVVSLALVSVASAERAQDKVVYFIAEPNRLVASNALLGRFDELKLNAKESIAEYIEAEAVIVVITNQRYIAYGAYAPGWRALRRRASETLESAQAKDASASLVTSDRYLNFNGRRGVWAAAKRRLQ